MLMKMEIKMRMHRRIAVRNGGKPREDLPELVFARKKSEMAGEEVKGVPAASLACLVLGGPLKASRTGIRKGDQKEGVGESGNEEELLG